MIFYSFVNAIPKPVPCWKFAIRGRRIPGRWRRMPTCVRIVPSTCRLLVVSGLSLLACLGLACLDPFLLGVVLAHPHSILHTLYTHRYAVYRHGVLVEEVTDITDCWPEDAVAFLIGCSFSYDGALQEAGIPLRSAEAGRNVPMYTTSLPCRAAGRLHGNIVVSMKPIPALQVAQHVAITAQYPHAHGAPLCIDRPALLGIADLDQPDWGDSVPVRPDEVAVFHACGVTPQAVLLASKLPFAITHAPGHMFVTDRPSDLK